MTKKLLFPVIAAIISTTGFAEKATMDFSYADGDGLAAFGRGKTENIDVAMCLDNPSLIGMKITKIQAYINTTEEISNTSLWLTSELALKEIVVDNKTQRVNDPNIATYDVTPEATVYAGYDMGLLQIELEEPYIITDEPIYIGYSLTVDKVIGDGQKYPIVLSTPTNPNGLFLHMSKSVLKWAEYSDKAGGVALINLFIEGDFPDYSLSINGWNKIYAEDNKDFDVVFNVMNIGSNTINNVKYAYSYDGKETATEAFYELPVPMEPSLIDVYTLMLPFSGISGIGSHSLDVAIIEVNGKPNESINTEAQCTVNVIPFKPVKRPLVEEYTGLWCGWCPRGFYAMEKIAEDYGDEQVTICYHNGDAMTVTNVYPISVPGYPSASIDRGSAIDPWYGSFNNLDFGIGVNLDDALSEFAVASIDVTGTYENKVINATASVKFVQDMESSNYQVGFVLVENGMSNPHWYQVNYFGYPQYINEYKGTMLEELTTWSPTAYGLIFNDVAVDVTAMRGIVGSLPSQIKVNEEYEVNFSFDISRNSVIQNKNNLVITAFVIDRSTGHVVNANKIKATELSGIEEISATDAIIISRKYYDLNGRIVENPSKGLFIVSDKLSDGSTKTSKVMINR